MKQAAPPQRLERSFSRIFGQDSNSLNSGICRAKVKRFMTQASQPGDAVPPEWLEEFEAAARRPLETRFRYSFIHTYKPVLDDAPFRAFDTMEEYRRWCEEKLPDWLGYGRL